MIDYLHLNIISPATASHTGPGGVRSRLKSVSDSFSCGESWEQLIVVVSEQRILTELDSK